MRIALAALIGVGGLTGQVQTLPMPAGGTVQVKDSYGELAVEGWDRPEVQLTMGKSAKGAAVTMTRMGDQIVIVTKLARGAERHLLDYRIRMPRNGKLTVDHGSGEIHVADMAGDIHATVCHGAIMLNLPPDGHYGIDARASIGDVVSDFPGKSRRRPWIFGHWFESGKPAGQAHRLFLRAGFGDILILKTIHPALQGRQGE
ncbi:MAG TPA: hypothetical protein VKB88_41780 [Bryobacteraceae bacterium]|nr:hypothetical protein [Bryobacteraceae bacterium]